MVGQRAFFGRSIAVGLTGLWALGCAHGADPSAEHPSVDLAALAEETTSITGSPLPRGLGSAVVDRAEVEEILRVATAADWPGDEAERYAEGLISLGLWPEDQNLLDTLLSVSADEIGGFYLHRERRLYVVDEARMSFGMVAGDSRRDAGREFVVAHELIHAHQHASHPDLIEFYISWHAQDDAASAAAAALEGDALRASIEVFSGEQGLPAPEVIVQYFGLEPDGRLSGMPALVRLTHAFPYVRGYPLAHRERASLLDHAPASTEQVMHAEQRESDFWAMDLSGVAALLPSECEVVYENTLGELGISVMFDDLTTDPDAGVWTGWDGDRYLAARCGDQRALLWVTAWDSREDAHDFAQAYGRVASAVAERAHYEEAPRATLTGKAVVISSRQLQQIVPRLPTAIRRARVATLPELRAHFEND